MKAVKKKKYVCRACRKDYPKPKKHSSSGMKICPNCGYSHVSK